MNLFSAVKKGKTEVKGISSLFLTILFILSLSLVCPAKEQDISDRTCLSCHREGTPSGLASVPRKIPPAVNPADLTVSVHKEVSCQSCHTMITATPHPEKLPAVECSSCHETEGNSYASSIHGKDFLSGKENVPSCTTCHGTHRILKRSNPESLAYPVRLIDVCLTCHLDEKIEAEYNLPGAEIFKAYKESIHGKAVLKSGLQVSAVCNDCHGAHNILPPDDPTSLVNKKNIPSVCGKCHTKIVMEFNLSIHGRALDEGIEEAPSCTDCHGEHSIARISDPKSGVYSMNIPKTCAECHEGEGLSNKYGILSKRLKTYMDSYHGVATKFGQVVVANCSSCHGIHDILPSSDPLSSIHPVNLSRTCGHCHPGIGERAAMGRIHIEAKPESSLGKFIVRRFYYWFIGSLMFIFLLYVLFDILRHRKIKKIEGKQE